MLLNLLPTAPSGSNIGTVVPGQGANLAWTGPTPRLRSGADGAATEADRVLSYHDAQGHGWLADSNVSAAGAAASSGVAPWLAFDLHRCVLPPPGHLPVTSRSPPSHLPVSSQSAPGHPVP